MINQYHRDNKLGKKYKANRLYRIIIMNLLQIHASAWNFFFSAIYYPPPKKKIPRQSVPHLISMNVL